MLAFNLGQKFLYCLMFLSPENGWGGEKQNKVNLLAELLVIWVTSLLIILHIPWGNRQ